MGTRALVNTILLRKVSTESAGFLHIQPAIITLTKYVQRTCCWACWFTCREDIVSKLNQEKKRKQLFFFSIWLSQIVLLRLLDNMCESCLQVLFHGSTLLWKERGTSLPLPSCTMHGSKKSYSGRQTTACSGHAVSLGRKDEQLPTHL